MAYVLPPQRQDFASPHPGFNRKQDDWKYPAVSARSGSFNQLSRVLRASAFARVHWTPDPYELCRGDLTEAVDPTHLAPLKQMMNRGKFPAERTGPDLGQSFVSIRGEIFGSKFSEWFVTDGIA
jgi:hypothetical protein